MVSVVVPGWGRQHCMRRVPQLLDCGSVVIKHTIPGCRGQNLGLSALCPKGKWMLLCSVPRSGSQLWAAKSSLAALDSGFASSTEADIFLREALCKDTGVNTPWTALGKPPGLRNSTLLLPLQQRNFPACPIRKPSCAYPGWSPCERTLWRWLSCVPTLTFHSYIPSPQAHPSCRGKPLLWAPHHSTTCQWQRWGAGWRDHLSAGASQLGQSLHQSHPCPIRSSPLGKGLG